jgi:hypothetical protein
MISKPQRLRRTGELQGMAADPVTIFTMPKAFRGHIGVIQRNALQSWLQLRPQPEIILFGNDEGVAAAAAEWRLRHEPDVRRSDFGTPLMDDMFRRAHGAASHDTLVYINADILLLDDFTAAVARVAAAGLEQFLLIGRRIDVNVGAIDFKHDDWRERIGALANTTGALAPRVCKDYFVFRKPLFADIPPFAIGRAVYDNWFVYHAREKGVPVIDATAVVRAIHQNHDYAHAGSRGQAYVKGEEAKRNRRLAGGLRLIRGSTTDWELTPESLRKRRIPSDWVQFGADLPRFLRLLLELYGWIDGAYARSRRATDPDNRVESPQTASISRP